MQWNDSAIILSSQPYGENGSLVRLLTHQHGLYAGIVRGGASGRQRGIYQPGNVVEATWKARLPEHLGMLSAELLSSSAALFLDDPLRLNALTALCALTQGTLPERQAEEALFLQLLHLLASLKRNTPGWLEEVVWFESALLTEMGFGLDLTECAATGKTDRLCYVSPKSGRAVSEEAGSPYKDKLLALPAFLRGENRSVSNDDIIAGLRLTGYFLEKHGFAPKGRPLPPARERLSQLIRPLSKLNSGEMSALESRSGKPQCT